MEVLKGGGASAAVPAGAPNRLAGMRATVEFSLPSLQMRFDPVNPAWKWDTSYAEGLLLREDGTYYRVALGCGPIICGASEDESANAVSTTRLTLSRETKSWYPNRSDQLPAYQDRRAPKTRGDTLPSRSLAWPGAGQPETLSRPKLAAFLTATSDR